MRITLPVVVVVSAIHCVYALASSPDNFTSQIPPRSAPLANKTTSEMPLADFRLHDFPIGKAANALNHIAQAQNLATRGAKEAKIYRTISPSVVLIVTDEGLGSGVLVDQKTILTNAHVTGPYSEVAVIFKPRQEGAAPGRGDILRGHVVARDQVRDLALIEVPLVPNGAQPISLGNESEIEIGADVHAIGHPTGEAWTYTKGVISQFRKDYRWKAEDGVEHHADVIQTQTPINPGNSGGPLISQASHLIGINSFKAEGEGLNFAISIEDVAIFLRERPAAIALSQPKKCDLKVLYDGRNKENNANVRSMDWNCSGKIGALVVIPDDLKKPITLMVSTLDTGEPDEWFYDTKRSGKWDYVLISSKHDGKIDVIGYDIGPNLQPARFEPYHGSG